MQVVWPDTLNGTMKTDNTDDDVLVATLREETSEKRPDQSAAEQLVEPALADSCLPSGTGLGRG